MAVAAIELPVLIIIALVVLIVILLVLAFQKLSEKEIEETLPKDKPKPTEAPKPKEPPDTGPVPVPCRPTGLSRNDPIPIQWFKVREDDYYPRTITVQGTHYDRDDPKPERLPHGEPIGVHEIHWPRPLKIVQLIPEDRGPNADRFRAVLEGYGFDWSGLQADHVQDIQWEGPDSFSNLWPMSSSANGSAGPLQNQRQRISYCVGPLGPLIVNKPLQDERIRLNGRFFIIHKVARF